jgi:hypothetical protein
MTGRRTKWNSQSRSEYWPALDFDPYRLQPASLPLSNVAFKFRSPIHIS